MYTQQPSSTYIPQPTSLPQSQPTVQFTTINPIPPYEQYVFPGATPGVISTAPGTIDYAPAPVATPTTQDMTGQQQIPMAQQDVSLCSPTPYPNQAEQFTCNEHGLFFPSAAILAQHHLQVHMVNKPYKCLDCGQGFTFYSGLKIHARVDHGKLLESASLHKAVTGSIAATPNTAMVAGFSDQQKLITVIDPNTGIQQQMYQTGG